MQTNYLKLFIVVVLLHFTTINSRIVAPDTYERMIQKKTNDELKETYNAHREGLTAQPIEFPPEIEEDIKFTQTPRYKIDMFKVVIQEIARRCTATKTIDELANLADLFFKKDNPNQEIKKRITSRNRRRSCRSQKNR